MAARRSYINTIQKTEYMYETIPDRIKYFAEKCPDKEAFVFLTPGKDRQVITCAEIFERSVKFAKGLVKLGVNQKDIVAVIIPNSPEWLICTVGILMVGAIALHTLFLKADGGEVLALLSSIEKCSMIVLDPRDGKDWNVATNFIDKVNHDGTVESRLLPSLKRIIFTKAPEELNKIPSTLENISQSYMPDEDIQLPNIDPDDEAVILTTSGSTGTPKAAIYTHFGITLGGKHMYEAIKVEEDDVYFNDRSFSWVGGYPSMYLAKGCTIVTLKECNMTEFSEITNFFLEAIEKEKCTVALIIPPVMAELMQTVPKCTQFPLKSVVTGGMPLPARFVGLLGKIGQSLTNVYGCTEVGLAAAFRIEQESEYIENYIAGYPGSGREIKIVDEKERIVSQNTLGEIWLRGPGMLVGYQNFPEKYLEVMTSSGWFKTGDMGLIRENGLLVCQGRKSDVIHFGIRNVFPSPMEAELRKCKGVKEAVIVPVPDEILNQQICACVIRDSDLTITADDVHQYFADHLAVDFLWGDTPGYYLFFEKFPRTATGKIIRKEVEKIARLRLGK